MRCTFNYFELWKVGFTISRIRGLFLNGCKVIFSWIIKNIYCWSFKNRSFVSRTSKKKFPSDVCIQFNRVHNFISKRWEKDFIHKKRDFISKSRCTFLHSRPSSPGLLFEKRGGGGGEIQRIIVRSCFQIMNT